jgi:predicted N-acetyltransferase YhbS
VIGSRIAFPVRDLARSIDFYRDQLGLMHTGGFRDHAGYDGAFFALPGGGELEVTTGPVPPGDERGDDLLLVLYAADRTALQRRVEALTARGIESVPAANPYWNRAGHLILDPDGYRVVIAVRERSVPPPLHVDWHTGDRAELRALFELAEDSAERLDAYLDLGTVLVARSGAATVGHLQLVPAPAAAEDEIELKNMAVLPTHRAAGVGRALVDEAVQRAERAGIARMVVATASADTGNLRFYQRVGFRMLCVDHDAFTPETGYPESIHIDGIELRDRVWFIRTLTPTAK